MRSNREKSQAAASRGQLPNFSEGELVLVAREELFGGEKRDFRWRGHRRILKVLSDYLFQVEDLRNGMLRDIHGSRLKFYRDASQDTEVIMSHVLSSETGMPVAHLLCLIESHDGLKVFVLWKGLPDSQDSSEPLERVYEDVPRILFRLLQRKNTPPQLAAKTRSILGL